jgi:hypothetical protein
VRDVVLPVLVLVPVPVGIGTIAPVGGAEVEPVDVAAVTQGSAIVIVLQVVSPNSPAPQPASAKPLRTKIDTDAIRMIASHNPKDIGPICMTSANFALTMTKK